MRTLLIIFACKRPTYTDTRGGGCQILRTSFIKIHVYGWPLMQTYIDVCIQSVDIAFDYSNHLLGQ